MVTHLCIGDPHATPHHHNERFELLGKLIVDRKPDVIINIGDMADMPSLCVSPDTDILMKTWEWKKAGDIEIGEEIIGFIEKKGEGNGTSYRKFKSGKVTQNTRFISPKGYRITTMHGTVTCSSDHKFMSHNLYNNGAKRAFRTCKELQVGWSIMSLGSNWGYSCCLSQQELGYLAGFLDGEGNYHQGRLSWSQNDGEVAEYVKSLFIKMGFNVQYYEEEGRPNLKHYYIKGSHLNSWKALHYIKPKRLLPKMTKCMENKTCAKYDIQDAEILSIEELDNVEVIGLETTIGTYISNNLFSHNCSYDKGKKTFEGRRYKKDIASVIDAQKKLFAPIKEYNKKAKDNHKKRYKPKWIMLAGNHDYGRINRLQELQPELEGVISTDDLQYEKFGWKVYPFLEPAYYDGVAYSHYFTSGVMGRPIGGEHIATSLINKKHMSCTSGHIHTRDFSERTRPDGSKILGLVCGCYLDVDQEEAYAGEANKLWWKGVVMCHNVVDGYYEPEFISMKMIRNKYA